MMKPTNDSTRPGLLVSVRNADEALAALAGGADVIDVKEPDRGPLGAADTTTILTIVRAVKDRAPVTVALGELADLASAHGEPLPLGVSLFKIGLADCRPLPNWRESWLQAIAGITSGNPPMPRPVAVVYADWRAARAPEPHDVLEAALAAKCPALLVDTWDKSSGSVFNHWSPEPLGRFLQLARSRGLIVVLAGSLTPGNLVAAAGLAPDLVAVRTAACEGGRHGTVSAARVRDLQALLAAATPPQKRIFEPSKNFLDNDRELRILESSSSARFIRPNFLRIT